MPSDEPGRIHIFIKTFDSTIRKKIQQKIDLFFIISIQYLYLMTEQ